MTRLRWAVGIVRSVRATARREQLVLLAAVASYAFVSMIPLALVALAVAAALGSLAWPFGLFATHAGELQLYGLVGGALLLLAYSTPP